MVRDIRAVESYDKQVRQLFTRSPQLPLEERSQTDSTIILNVFHEFVLFRHFSGDLGKIKTCPWCASA